MLTPRELRRVLKLPDLKIKHVGWHTQIVTRHGSLLSCRWSELKELLPCLDFFLDANCTQKYNSTHGHIIDLPAETRHQTFKTRRQAGGN